MTGRRLIVFDVDGTLINSQDAIHTAMTAAFSAEGVPPPDRSSVLSIVGLSLPEAMSALAPDLAPARRDRLVAAYRERALAARHGAASPLYPGARAALDRLAMTPRTCLGVATGKARRGLDHVFAIHRLGDYFVTSQTADDHPSKPHPSMLMAALAETGCSSSMAVMIGDTDFDMAMGRAAGLRTIGVAWGYHPVARLAAAGAEHVIADFSQLDAALAAVAERPG